jgi:uncharacterized protein
MTESKFAVVTGASTGIGFELASIAAEEGYDLLVVANEAFIDAAANDLRLHGTHVQSVEADLSTTDGVDRLLATTGGRPIDVLCANAGAGHGNAFLDQSFDQIRLTIDTNVTGTLYLLHKVMTDMVARGEGKILVTGSIAGYVPGAFNATYNATKAFIDNFTDAVRNELHDTQGVTLTTLLPGATETEFFDRAEMLATSVGKAKKGDPAKVAREGWDGAATIVPGLMNKVIVATAGLVPPPILAAMHRKMAEPPADKESGDARHD